MDFITWFRKWLIRHPVKEPAESDRAFYTAQVMERVRSIAKPAPSHAPSWRPWSQLALVAATVAIAVMVVNKPEHSHVSVAEEIEQDVALLASLNEEWVSDLTDDLELLSEELNAIDSFILAEGLSQDEDWLNEALLLLEEFDEDMSWEDIEDISDDEWLGELEFLDESELKITS